MVQLYSEEEKMDGLQVPTLEFVLRSERSGVENAVAHQPAVDVGVDSKDRDK